MQAPLKAASGAIARRIGGAKLLAMSWKLTRVGLAAVALAAGAACDRLNLGPPTAEPAPTQTAPEPAPVDPALREHVGEAYPDFAADAGARYDPDTLGLNAADRARLWRAMAAAEGSVLLSGGGAEALVFRGCAEPGCEEGAAIVAVDIDTGAAFAGVRDVGGADVLAPNERLEALLRLNSPSRDWHNPQPTP